MADLLPALPQSFETVESFVKYFTALLDLSEDPKKLEKVKPEAIKDSIRVFLKRAEADVRRQLDFSKRLKSGELQAGSARYFTEIASNFKAQKALFESILEKEFLDAKDAAALQAGFAGLQEVLLEVVPAEEKIFFKGAFKKPDVGKILSLFKDNLKGMDAKLRKNLEPFLPLFERMGNVLNRPFPDNHGRVHINSLFVNILIAAVALTVGALVISLILFMLADSVYHGSHHSAPWLFKFFETIGYFPRWPMDQVKGDAMVRKTFYFVEFIILLFMGKWWTRSKQKK